MKQDAAEDKKIQAIVNGLSAHPREHWAYRGAKREHAHAFIKYPAMMVPQMQSEIIDLFVSQYPNIHSVYDPFVGSGTVMTEAMLHGLDFYGQDINPLAVLSCYTKKGPFYIALTQKKVEILKRRIKDDGSNAVDINFPKIDKWFTLIVQQELSKIRRAIIAEKSLTTRRFFWLTLASAVRATSNSRTTTFKLHIRSEEDIQKRNTSPIEVFLQELDANVDRLKTLAELLKQRKLLHNGRFQGKVIVKCKNVVDNRGRRKQERFDFLLTSPPYGDNHTTVPYGQYSYLPLQWIAPTDLPVGRKNLFLQSSRFIDKQSLGGIENRDEKKYQKILKLSPSLKEFLQPLEGDEQNRQYKVSSFFYDMYKAIKNIVKQLSDNAFMVFVIGNRRVAGLPVPMDSIMRELLEQEGARFITKIARDIPQKRMALKNRTTDTITEESILIMRGKTNNC